MESGEDKHVVDQDIYWYFFWCQLLWSTDVQRFYYPKWCHVFLCHAFSWLFLTFAESQDLLILYASFKAVFGPGEHYMDYRWSSRRQRILCSSDSSGSCDHPGHLPSIGGANGGEMPEIFLWSGTWAIWQLHFGTHPSCLHQGIGCEQPVQLHFVWRSPK